MGVVVPKDEYYPTNQDDAERCFLCANDFDPSDGEPVVYWKGSGTYIAFHRDCAASFVLRFARDAWEAQGDAGRLRAR